MHIVGLLARTSVWSAAVLVMSATALAPGGLLSWRAAGVAEPSLRVSGSIAALEPRRAAVLHLLIDNASAKEALVRTLDVLVTGGPADCPASALRIRPWRGEQVVPARGHARIDVGVVLASSSASCRGATWQLSYTTA
jgi:hypothetical protein